MRRTFFSIIAFVLTIAAEAQTLNVKVGSVFYQFPAEQTGEMYYADGKISFTEDASVAVQQITSSSNYAACIKNTNNDQFYHSGSNKCFMYSNNKNANNLRFFKLSE